MARGRGARNRRSARRMQARQAVRPGANDALALTVTAEDLAEFEALAAQGGSFPLGDRAEKWDAGAAEKSYTLPGDGSCYMWRDPEGDRSSKSSYKLAFVSKDGGKHAVWGAVTAIAGALSGARGGVSIPSGDVAGVKAKVEAYYAKARTKYKDDGIKTPWAAAEEGVEAFARSLAVAEFGTDADPTILAVAEAIWTEAFAPMADCANCDHAYTAHLGTEGPCTMADCGCEGYQGTEAATADAPVTFQNDWTNVVEMGGLTFPFQDNGSGGITLATGDGNTGNTTSVEIAHPASPPGLAAAYKAWEAFQAHESTAPSGRITFELGNFQVTFAAADPALLPEHQPDGSAVPAPAPSGEPAPAPAARAGEVPWTSVFCPEGKLTSDGRAFAPGSIEWRELPLTLMAMTETSEGGHIGAEVAGRIDEIWRDSAAGLIRARGVFADTEYGALIACLVFPEIDPEALGITASLVADQVLRGVSVDLAIHNYEVGPRSDWFDDQGNWAPKEHAERQEPSILDMLLGSEDAEDPTIAVVTSAEIGMTTVCPFPAFKEAKIAVGDSLVAGANPAFWTYTGMGHMTLLAPVEPLSAPVTASEPSDGSTVEEDCGCEGEALTASAAGLAPVAPPSGWFENPGLEEPTGLTITEDGQVYGHAAVWGVCHIGLPGQCRTAPHSASGYEFFHLGEVLCDDGARIPVGTITAETGHAALSLDPAATVRHYDDTGTAVAHVVAGEDEHGIWVAGALNPEASEEQVRTLRGAKLSGDWRRMNESGHELVALLSVNVPGFPVPRARAAIVASAEGEQEVYALVAAGIEIGPSDLTAEEREQFEALARRDEFTAILEDEAA